MRIEDHEFGRCTGCGKITHLDLLDGKPAHPHEQDFSKLECKDCYGDVPWMDGNTRRVLTYTGAFAEGSRAHTSAVKKTEEARRIDAVVRIPI